MIAEQAIEDEREVLARERSSGGPTSPCRAPAARRRGGAGGAWIGSFHCSHAISCPFGAHGVASFVVNDRFSQYSVAGAGVIARQRQRELALLAAARCPGPAARPEPIGVAVRRHASTCPSAMSFALMKSNQLLTAMRPDARSTGVAVQVAVDVLDRARGRAPACGRPSPGRSGRSSRRCAARRGPPTTRRRRRSVSRPALARYSGGTGCLIPWFTQSHTNAPCMLVPE